ncbi:MAG TPA: ATP-binding protein [Tepidisphaeraceae bacterium]|nr:ATP-binding protein [Tepidisphaeraceae bacterium]
MTMTLRQETDTDLHEAYQEYVYTLRLRLSKFAYFLAIALVPAAISLDYFVYPELLGPILESRLWCDLVLLCCWLMIFTGYARRFFWFLNNAWLWAPMIAIVWMIYASEGAKSPYYAGLNLVMLAACLLTTYRAREAAALCATVIGCYVIACVLHDVVPPATALNKSVLVNGSLMFNNLYFLIATACVCVAAAHFRSKRRFEDFRLRHELDVNNDRLTLTIRKLQETEVQLVQSEKMNALGRLSAGLLHEVNNPLNYAFMALQVAEQEAAGNASLEETLGDLQEGMERIKSVIGDLRSFAHPSKVNEAEPFQISDALTTALRLTAHELQGLIIGQHGIEGVTVLGARTQIVHVLMNMLINAMHAVSGPALGRPPRVEVRCGYRPDGRLEIAILDNGVGVAPADLPRLLDPFFTTKSPDKGTGLGLSICETIVKNHGGEINITSEHGKWTRVAFDLPAGPIHSKVSA